ncbi:MAG: hypothetical protein DCF19_02180 [Pseudanabaena frigida]|uniref:Trypsin-co-occurring domain-containing protein n=1 Tax=Pseudanabaena frigida TaxID=945775 RepID=A0A2W4WI82_9CYAN|nr:MAG: hypothetical protein DCF19_02180 [Pseudanabaena frigida]
MSNFVAVNEESEDAFYIEVIPVESNSGIKKTSKADVIEKLTTERFDNALRKAVLPACNTFVSLWQEVKQSNSLVADSAEVEFNLGLTASGNMAIVQTSGQASFKIKVTWKFKPPIVDKKALYEQINDDIDLLKKEAEELEQFLNQAESSDQVEEEPKISYTKHRGIIPNVRKLEKLSSF